MQQCLEPLCSLQQQARHLCTHQHIILQQPPVLLSLARLPCLRCSQPAFVVLQGRRQWRGQRGSQLGAAEPQVQLQQNVRNQKQQLLISQCPPRRQGLKQRSPARRCLLCSRCTSMNGLAISCCRLDGNLACACSVLWGQSLLRPSALPGEERPLQLSRLGAALPSSHACCLPAPSLSTPLCLVHLQGCAAHAALG